MPNAAVNSDEQFERMLEELDVRLFDAIMSQTTPHDRQSLLACQQAVRTLKGEYVYLEIGSYLGGSLQPYVLDSRCRHIYSIDNRPKSAPDERGLSEAYAQNSTAHMLANLKRISPTGTDKITCFDSDVSQIDPAAITRRPQACFIDAEHTDEAVFRDFLFCHRVLDHDGVIFFHDAQIIYKGLRRVIQHLQAQKTSFRAYALPDVVFAIEFNGFAMHDVSHIRRMLIDNHVAYLTSLALNDHYRQFANRPVFKALRATKAFVRRAVSHQSRPA